MGSRATYCHHGHLIQESWQECPECCAEHDQREMRDALEDAVTEQRQQTAILRDMADEKSTQSSVLEGQQLAESAEKRFRMRDPLGAEQLITAAIGIDPDFVHFYLQRARYLKYLGKEEEAFADLRHAFERVDSMPGYFENLFRYEIPEEYRQLKPDIDHLILELKHKALERAEACASTAFSETKTLYARFAAGERPGFVKDLETGERTLRTMIESDRYETILSAVKFAEELQKKAASAIKQYDECAQGAQALVSQAEKAWSEACLGRYEESARNEVNSALQHLNDAKRAALLNTYSDWLKSAQLAKDAIQEIAKAAETRKAVIKERRAPLEEQLRKIEQTYSKTRREVQKSYDGQIEPVREWRENSERRLERSRERRPGCGTWFLIVVATITIMIVAGVNGLDYSVGSFFLMLGASIAGLYLTFRYIPVELARSNFSNAEKELGRLLAARNSEISALDKSLGENPDVRELKRRLAEIGE